MAIEFTSDKDDHFKTNDNIKHGKVFAMPTKAADTYQKLADEKTRHLSKPEDLEKFRLSPADESNSGLWEQAWEQVKIVEEDWKSWPQFHGVKDLNAKDVVPEVQGFAQRRRDEAEKGQQHVLGTRFTYREMCSKVARCAKTFEIVGDLVVQAEPVYSALPWVNISILENLLLLLTLIRQGSCSLRH